MQVSAEQLDPCTLILEVIIPTEQVGRTFDSVYREFSRYVNVPGFRPGKAPRALVEKYVNTDRLLARVQEKLVNDTFPQALEEHDVTPYRTPIVDGEKVEANAPYTYKATIPLEPQVTLGEYTGITVAKPVFAITDAMVEERVERLREDRARLERVTGRGVEMGDYLITEVQTHKEGDAEPSARRRQLLQIGSTPPGMDEALLGLEIDEERTFNLTFAEDYEDESLRGATVAHTVKLFNINARNKPEITDEFAMQAAGVETVEALRESLRETMEREVKRLSDQMVEQRIIQQVVANADVFFPEALVKEETEDAYRQLAAELRQQNVSYEQFLQANNLSAEEHLEYVRAQSSERVRTILVLRQVAIQEAIQVTEEAINTEFGRILREGRLTEEQHDDYIDDERRRMMVGNALVQQNLHDFLFQNNIIVEVEAPQAPTQEELDEANTEE